MHDLVIRAGTVVDGTGAPARSADIAIDGGVITEIGSTVGAGRREIDADGLVVTPGWVDIHTHYDGQVTWDPYLTPSSYHGVTTIVMGNCGVGFAPARPGEDQHRWLIELMESVEDIPGSALTEGIDWGWESFPEYLDALDAKPLMIDVGAQVPHCSVRAYVMGERGAEQEEASPEDIAAMARIVREGIRAGALGFTTSRTKLHRTSDGGYVPGTFAHADEVLALGHAVAEGGGGVFEMASDVGIGHPDGGFKDDLEWATALAVEAGIPVTYALTQNDAAPEAWRELLARSYSAGEQGGNVIAQVAARPAGLLLGLQTTMNPFTFHKAWKEMARLPLAERVAAMRTPEVRERFLGEQTRASNRFTENIALSWHKMFPVAGTTPDYEPGPDQSVAGIAARRGRTPAEVCYDALLVDDGKGFVFFPLADYTHNNLDGTLERLRHPGSIVSLADGGAHCRMICDASSPTFMLTHWVRDRDGERLGLEEAVKLQTADTADLYGIGDRGRLVEGKKADANVIDFDNLGLEPPYLASDLPAGGERLLQHSRGYQATIVAGEVVMEDGETTGALPGKLIRGRR